MFFINKLTLIFLLKIVLGSFIATNGQLLLQDDFKEKSDYWFWRSDGNQNIPSVSNGMLHLKLENALDSEYCNTEIYNPTEPYNAGTQARIRLKASDIHHGSRGWGFWDGDIDIHSVALDFDVAWIMQQGSHIADTNYRWFLFGVDSDTITNKEIFNLDEIIDETQWHTYKIIWHKDKVDFFINDMLLYQAFNYIPNESMRMDIWIDNRVLNRSNPTNRWHNTVESSEMMVDFVEISEIGGPDIPRTLQNDIIFWDSPNSFPNGEVETLWKDYEFSSTSDGEALLFLTGNAESYGTNEDDDDLKIILDGNDLGWDTDYSFNGDEIQGNGKSVSIPLILNDSNHKLQLVSNITPFLRDVIILFNKFGQVILNENINESSQKDGLWKTIDFDVPTSSKITFLISGKLDENDGIKIEIDNNNHGWSQYDMVESNFFSNLPSTVVIEEVLEKGPHQIRFHSQGNPTIYSIAGYSSPIITDIDDEEEINDNYNLSTYPNPFNAETNISYSTIHESHNKVTIVNSIGEKIVTLVNKYQTAGSYNLVWNASNQTSGLYFCIFKNDNNYKVKKLLLLK